MLKGLPASGKTTYARELVSTGWKRVNKDDLREMLDSSVWSKDNEAFVNSVWRNVIKEALYVGNVVVDDTNLNPAHTQTLMDIVISVNGSRWPHQNRTRQTAAAFDSRFFDTPLAECIKRDAAREKPVGENIIMDMHKKYLAKVTDGSHLLWKT